MIQRFLKDSHSESLLELRRVFNIYIHLETILRSLNVAANDNRIYKPLIISGNEPSGEEPIQEKENGQEYVGSKGYDENKRRMKTCTIAMTKK